MKVIAIGLNKTGTKSLNMAFATLGFNSLHVNPFEFHKAIEKAIKNGKKILHYLEPYDFLSDIWVHHGLTNEPFNDPKLYDYDYKFRIVDRIMKDYPDTLLLNNHRRYKEWMESRRKHIEKSDGHWQIYDEKEIRDEFLNQILFVEKTNNKYYKHLFDFEIGVSGWPQLCKMLDMEEPDEPFPWKKKQREKYKKAYIKKMC